MFLNYTIGEEENHSFTIGYSRRIDRPNYESLNPFLFYLDQFTYMKGNPFLRPQFTDAYNFEYALFDAVFLGAEFSRTKDAMMDVTQQVDSTGIGYLITENLSTVDNAGFSLGFPIPIGKWFMMENEFLELYSSTKSDLFGEELSRQNWGFEYDGSMSFYLPKNLTIQITGEYSSKISYGIFDMKNVWESGLNVTKFFNDKTWLVSFGIRDMFKTGMDRITVTFQGQDMRISSYDENRTFYFRVRYNFGQTKIKKSGYNSGADDLKNRTNKK